MKIISSAFENNTKIPSKHTCDGENINPPLSFSEVPANTKSLTLIVDDPDAPNRTFVHWILFNLGPKTIEIKENSVPQSTSQGITSAGKVGFIGACPPNGTHRYFFKVYALDTVLRFNGLTKAGLEERMQGHIIDSAELIGLYSRI